MYTLLQNILNKKKKKKKAYIPRELNGLFCFFIL